MGTVKYFDADDVRDGEYGPVLQRIADPLRGPMWVVGGAVREEFGFILLGPMVLQGERPALMVTLVGTRDFARAHEVVPPRAEVDVVGKVRQRLMLMDSDRAMGGRRQQVRTRGMGHSVRRHLVIGAVAGVPR